ncbi:hypothetical protein WJX74_001067 [Apatococcus lobatus]|uniref:Peptidase M48 domain-containing protein n=1 Tax=Apatococcus lobatus TaxID=904363 RepID=A0AAW1QNQ2_9CHLO
MFSSLRRGKKLYKPLQSLLDPSRGFFSNRGGYQHFGAPKGPKKRWFPSQGTVICIGVAGGATFEKTTRDANKQGALYPQHARECERVRGIGLKIANVAANGKGGGFLDHMKGIKWEYAVIRSEEPDAFVAPGGKVVVYTGLLDMVGGNDDQLAAVLAHEAGHTLARHVGEKLTLRSFSILAFFLIYAATGFPIPDGLLAGAIELPNSRKLESEADAIGLKLAAQACYNPDSAVQVFEKFNQIEKKFGADRIPGFLRTHPMNDARIAAIQKNLPAAHELYEASGCRQKESVFRAAFGQQWSSRRDDSGFF